MDHPTEDAADFTPEEVAVLEAAAAEAETGYSAAELAARPRRGRARSVGTEAAVVVPVRLDPERLRALDALAARDHRTRSQVIRDAIDHELASA